MFIEKPIPVESGACHLSINRKQIPVLVGVAATCLALFVAAAFQSTTLPPPVPSSVTATSIASCSTCSYRLWPDKAVYSVGGNVTIHIYPAVGGVGVAYGLFIIKPDGSNVSLHLNRDLAENAAYQIKTTDPAGLYRVELWGRVIYPGALRTLMGYCYFTVE